MSQQIKYLLGTYRFKKVPTMLVCEIQVGSIIKTYRVCSSYEYIITY